MRKTNNAALFLMTTVLFLSLSSFVMPAAVLVAPSFATVDTKTTVAPEWSVPKMIMAPRQSPFKYYGSELTNMSMDEFLALTPAKFRQMTGHRLGIGKSLELKMAQNYVRKHQHADKESGGLPQWAYIVMSLLALGVLAVGVASSWKGNDWWITLLLTFLFILPGIIYAFVVMKKYY